MASTSRQPKPGATALSVDNLVNSRPLIMTFSNDLHHHWAVKRYTHNGYDTSVLASEEYLQLHSPKAV
jgi:hypothetical protein